MNWTISAFEYTVAYFSSPLGIVELIATALLLINVYLLSRANIWNYIPGIIGVILYGWIFYQSKLYSDTILQWAFYVPAQIIGWWYWMYGGKSGKDTLEVTSMTWPAFFVVLLLTWPAIQLFGYFMYSKTDASFPYWDSAIALLSVVATVLMTKKYIENWYLWLAVDVIAVPIYYLKGLYVSSGLYVVFFCLSVYGLIKWSNLRQKERYAQAV
ncbi:nicotinamide mononucleotide transporter protein [Rhizobium phage RHph_I1_18]|nr:nicotinamide mononucleotide transporter protein [Rhizobium phage RHph_I1_18]